MRNQYDERYSIGTVRKYLRCFENAFEAIKDLNDDVETVYSNLNWAALKVSQRGRNNEVQLLMLSKEKTKNIGETFFIAGTEFVMEDDSQSSKKRTKRRKNEATDWKESDYKNFVKIFRDDIKNAKNLRPEELRLSRYKYYVFFSFLYYTGLRFGEARAVQWKNFYKKDGCQLMEVAHAIPKTIRPIDMKNADVWNTICLPKNKEARPQIINDELLKILTEYKKIQKPVSEQCFLFPQTFPNTIDVKHQKLSEEAGVPLMRIHDFRHSKAYHERFEEGNTSEFTATSLGHKDGGKLIEERYAPKRYTTNENELIRNAKRRKKG